MEPRYESANSVIFREMEEINEVIFFIYNNEIIPNGAYKIGFTLNDKIIFVKAFTCKFKGNVIGAYGCTFNRKAIMMYKTIHPCFGHFIRKKNWKKLLLEVEEIDPMVVDSIKLSLDKDYNKNTKGMLIKHKRTQIEKLKKRADYENVMTLY